MTKRISDDVREKIAVAVGTGQSPKKVSEKHGIATFSVHRICKEMGVAIPDRHGVMPSRRVKEFVSRCRKYTYRMGSGKDHKDYERLISQVKQLQEHGGFSQDQAYVLAAKERPYLAHLFREFDVIKYDPNPDSHPVLGHSKKSGTGKLKILDKEMSYRENLRWATEAAGRFLETEEHPESCPNGIAAYLYRQAVAEPKDFLGRLGQVESKGDVEADARSVGRVASEKTIEEIDEMLEAFDV